MFKKNKNMFKKNDKKKRINNYETEQIKEAFDIFDINRNGYIGVDELKEIFTIINEEVSEEELNEMIGLADKEGDGQVNWLNFYEFINGNGINEDIKRILLIKKKILNDLSYKKNKLSYFKYKEDNSFNESKNKSNYSENEYNKINNNDNNNYNEINDNLFDEVDDDGKKKMMKKLIILFLKC